MRPISCMRPIIHRYTLRLRGLKAERRPPPTRTRARAGNAHTHAGTYRARSGTAHKKKPPKRAAGKRGCGEPTRADAHGSAHAHAHTRAGAATRAARARR